VGKHTQDEVNKNTGKHEETVDRQRD